jgi:uncharacterized membrane protein YbhN (UPF0104 family)
MNSLSRSSNVFMTLKSPWGRLVLATVISLPLLWLALENADLLLLGTFLKTVDVAWLWGAASLMGLMQLISGLRICQLLTVSRSRVQPSLSRAVIVSCAHQTAQRFLPLRLGEVLMLWMVYRLMRIRPAANLRSWVVLRLWDFRFVAVGFAVSMSYMLFDHTSSLLPLAFCLLPAVLLIILSPMQLLKSGLWGIRMIGKFFSVEVITKIETIILEGIADLNTRPHGLLAIATLALASWLCSWMIFYCLLHSMSAELNLLQVLGITCGAALISAIPLQTVAGLGINETGQTVLFILAGLESTRAASLSLAFSFLHMGLCLLVPAAIAGLVTLCIFLHGRFITVQPGSENEH